MKERSAFLCYRIPPQSLAKIKVSLSPSLFLSFFPLSFKNIRILKKGGEKKQKEKEEEGKKISK